jgi:hypothetical protein
MEKRYQVFVSSTYSDLRDERERVLKELTKIGYIAAGMEQFPSTDEDKFEYIQRSIKLGRLNAFVKRLEDRKIVNRWVTIDELVHSVKDSVNDLARRKPAVGWIRGDKALDPKIINDLEALRRERDELKDTLSKVISRPQDDGALAFKEEFVLRGTAGERSIELRATIGQVLEWLSEVLYFNTKEQGVKYALEVLTGQQNPEFTEPVKIHDNEIRLLRYKLDFAGFISVFPQAEATASGMQKFLCWSMTAKAKKLLGSATAILP